MTKYSFLVYEKEYNDFLLHLRNLGIAHIIEKLDNESEEIRKQFQHIQKLNLLIRDLEKRIDSKKINPNATNQIKGEELFTNIVELITKKEELLKEKTILKKEYDDTAPWGLFEPEVLKNLENKNIKIRFFICPKKSFNEEWIENHDVFKVNMLSGQIYFVFVQNNEEDIQFNAEEVFQSEKNLKKIGDDIDNLEVKIKDADDKIDYYANNDISELENYKKQLIENIEFDKATLSAEEEVNGKIKLVEAWCPSEKSGLLELGVSKLDVVILKAEPQENDKVPILLKNKKFSKDFESIGEMYSLPKYGEMDLTPFFAPFYALFFGFCLGDVGYGILIAVASLIAKHKLKKEMKSLMNLVFYLGAATILFGLIGGTFFGINLYQTNLPIYSSLNIYLDSNNTNINTVLFYLSLLIGAIQIIFGLILKAVNETRQLGWKLAVGTYGWLFLIIGMICVFAAGNFDLIGASTQSLLSNTVLVVSGLMILLFNNLQRKIYINLGVGIWNSYNMITGILGDLLSYIRLFALGISSAILGFVFNSLALSMSGSIPVLSIVIMIIILLIGHAINLFMSGLGAFVHPMRLTFVEFYKNAGFSGGGNKYKPLKKIT